MGSDERRPSLSIHEVFDGRYVIEQQLGQGGMGTVYRALDRALDEVVALKVLARGAVSERRASERFRAEVRLARRVTHTNVARVYDLGERDGVLYFTMECIDGDTLRGALSRRGRFPLHEGLAVGAAITSGLAEVHAHGIVHRDLKPTNVMLSAGGRVVLTDFGVARDLTAGSELTVGPIGTASYMAPEQALGRPVDGRADLYALGVILFEVFTGVHPLHVCALGTTEQERERALRHALSSLSPALSTLIMTCLATTPEARPASAVEVERALSSMLAASQGQGATAALAADLPRVVPPPPTSVPSAAPESHALEAASLPDRALAVLPFRYRGVHDEADEAMGDVLSEELVDALSRTRGLRVLGTAMTAPWRESRDVRDMGRALLAYAVVDGSMQRVGEDLRITVRLLDATTGMQLYTQRVEGPMAEMSVMQEQVATRIAEELRVEITSRVHAAGLPLEAVERYLLARKHMATASYTGLVEAAEELARCTALAETFGPAHAAHAITALRALFFAQGDGRNNWEGQAEASVRKALAVAPDLAETHLAAGILATQEARFAEASRHLRRAVDLAPGYAHAQEYLGSLECEAGKGERGMPRLLRAVELDPHRVFGWLAIARQHALSGRYDHAYAALDATERHQGQPGVGSATLRVRLAAWSGDQGRLRHEADRVLALRGSTPRAEIPSLYARAALGQLGGAELDARWKALLGTAESARFSSLLLQVHSELAALQGRLDAANLSLMRAATGILVDIAWLDRCPVLAPLREVPTFAALRKKVAARAELLWTGA